MKRVLVPMLVLVAMCVSSVANAQKIGRVLFQEIVLVLPETDSVQAKIKNHAEQLDADLEQMRVEFNNKLEDYQKKKATYSVAIDQQKQRELNDYNTRLTEFAQTAQQEVETIQLSLTQPLFTKVGDAIKKIAKEQSLTMVVDLTQGNNIMYLDEATTTDITPLVKKSLGIDPNAKPKPLPQQPAAAPAK
ncbi:MAG: OmpH family outer membrane protein [Rikenellaceae bacterium]